MVEVMTSDSIALLANIIYEREMAEKNPSVFTFSQLRSIAEAKDERLKIFFDEIEESACMRKKNKEKRKKLNCFTSISMLFNVLES